MQNQLTYMPLKTNDTNFINSIYQNICISGHVDLDVSSSILYYQDTELLQLQGYDIYYSLYMYFTGIIVPAMSEVVYMINHNF